MADIKLGTTADVKAAVTEDVVYRIEVFLSGRKSSVVVMRTMAKLYSLHNNGGDAEWKMLAYGVPCILLQRVTTEHDSPFAVKVIVAEHETGTIQWEGEVNHDSQYQAMQANFHAFTVNKQTFALQFVSLPEASRMLVSVRDFIRQKEETDIVSFNQSNQRKSKSKPKRKTSKKNISTPSNFKHVTRVSNQSRSNGDELGNSFTRHLSFNAGDRVKPVHASNGGQGQQQQQQQGPSTSPPQGNPLYAEIGEHLLEEKVQTGLPASNHQAGLPPQNPLVPLMRGSVRLPRREEEGDNEVDEPLIERGSLRQSLPSHIKQRVRVPLSKVNFESSNAIPSLSSRHPAAHTMTDQVDAAHVVYPPTTGNPTFPSGPGGQRLDQGPMLSSQPNLATSREMGGAPQHFPVQQTQPPSSSAHPPHALQKLDTGVSADLGHNNLPPGHNSLPRPSGNNNQFGSAVPSNLRLLSAGPMSASMPAMERGFAGPPPPLAPLQEHYPRQQPSSQQYARQDGAGVGGITAPTHLPPPPLNPSPHLRFTGASYLGGGASAPNQHAGPSPSFVPPPPFSHSHRTIPFASSASVTPSTPSTPSTPAPPPSTVSSNGSKIAPPPPASTAASSPLYDVLPPLQQPSPPKPARVDSEHPPKSDVRGRPLSYVQWPAPTRNGMYGHDSIRSADLHATDV